MENQHSAQDEIGSDQIQKTFFFTREYACPCGKSYLSYPALFTHVKQKHNGKPPGELIKPAAKINLKRGRPKGIKNREGGGRLSATDYTRRLGEPNAIEMEFLHFLICVAKDLKDDAACNYSRFNLYYTYLGCNKIQYKAPIITPQFAFTHFLKQLGQKIGQRNTIINGVVIILGLYLSFIDELYQSQQNLIDFSQNESPEQLSLFANSFITSYHPKMIKKFNLQGIQFFQSKNVSKTLEFLFLWMYKKQYVNQYLMIKGDQKHIKLKEV